MSARHEIYTTCTRDCANTCGLIATVEDGRLVKLTGAPDHPLTQGRTCVKASMYVARVYDPERVTHPLMRESGTEKWRPATWDQVLDRIARNMKRFRDKDGPESILYYQGYGERTALKLLNSYFFNLFGGVTTLRGSLCGGTGQASQNLDLGERISHDPLDHYNSASMILWGRNPVSTNISLIPIIKAIQKRGGKIILIDPFKSKSSIIADKHIAPAPGGDAFLAMAAAKLIYAWGAQDSAFLRNNTQGADEYKEFLEQFSLAELYDRAGVEQDDVQFLADTLRRHRPTATLLGWGLHRHENAHHMIRCIDALAAICGNIGLPGGGVSQGFEEYGPYDQQFWGAHLNPPRRTLLMPRLGDEILNAANPKIRMIMTSASNPVCMAPNSKKVSKAFRSAEFVVYSGHFMDDTAEHAHIFLPATTFLEEQDVMATYGHNFVGPVNQAIPPVGECKSEFRMFYELSARFSFAEKFQRSEQEWLHDICAPIREQGCSMQQLSQGPFRLDAPMAPYLDGKFPTKSGKFEFTPPFEPDELGRIDPDFPYKLLTVAPHKYLCSERTLAEHEPLPVVRLHPEEAKLRGVSDGETILVKSRIGEVKARLHTDQFMRRDCLVGERGGWIKAGHGLNRLTRDMPSTVGDGTPYYETSVTVAPCA